MKVIISNKIKWLLIGVLHVCLGNMIVLGQNIGNEYMVPLPKDCGQSSGGTLKPVFWVDRHYRYREKCSRVFKDWRRLSIVIWIGSYRSVW